MSILPLLAFGAIVLAAAGFLVVAVWFGRWASSRSREGDATPGFDPMIGMIGGDAAPGHDHPAHSAGHPAGIDGGHGTFDAGSVDSGSFDGGSFDGGGDSGGGGDGGGGGGGD